MSDSLGTRSRLTRLGEALAWGMALMVTPAAHAMGAAGAVRQPMQRKVEPSACIATARARPDVFTVARREGGRTVVTVCIAGPDTSLRIASYHAQLVYDTLDARLVGVEHPADGMRVENVMRRGTIDFAGAASAMHAGPVLIAVFAAARQRSHAMPFSTARPRLRVLELNGTDGRPLPHVHPARPGT